MLARASPPVVAPGHPEAATAGCRSSRSPASTPWTRPNVPAGAPADASAPATTSAVTSEVTGCPSCALTTTGQPAASAEAVSPPATEKANGKLDAANTATGPAGRVTRRTSGTTPTAGLTTASAYPPSRSTCANSRSCPVVRATSPISRSPPSAVSVSARTESSPARSSRASATASSASARRPASDSAPQAGAAATADATIASTSASVVSATGSPTGSPVRGSNPWIIGPPVSVHDLRLLRVRLRVAAALGQEVEVAALVGLGNVLAEQGAVAALELRRGGLPLAAALSQGPFGHIQRQLAGRDVQRDEVARLDESQRAADERLGSHMQHAGPIARAAHPGVGNPHHVTDALGQQVIGNGQHAVLGHARTALRARVAQHQDGIGRDGQGGIVDPFLHLAVGVEDDGRAAVLDQPRFGGDVLDDRPVGGEVPAQHRHPALGGQRCIRGPDDIIVIDRYICYFLAERTVVHRDPVQMQRAG